MQVSLSHCGSGWSGGAAGRSELRVRNTDSRAGEVYIARAGTDQVVASVDPLGPEAEADVRLALSAGQYVVVCSMEDADPVRGPPVTFTGPAPGSPAVAAVTQADLVGPTLTYQRTVTARLRTLVGQVRALDRAVASGDRAQAQQAWLTAHLTYETLGAAYGAFGDADQAVNGTPEGLPGGMDDPHFTGFHRIEQQLWHGAAASATRPFSRRLLSDVTALTTTFAGAQLDPHELVIRAHEITEGTAQHELTGRHDFGSGSTLATVDANLAGTQLALGPLRPLLRPRYPATARLDSRITRARNDIRGLSTAGHLPALDRLSGPDRRLVNSDVAELTELLAPVASILEPRRLS